MRQRVGLLIGDFDDARAITKLAELQIAAVLVLRPEYLPRAEAEDGEPLDQRRADRVGPQLIVQFQFQLCRSRWHA